MGNDDIPYKVRSLIGCCISSVSHLEVVLLLSENRDRTWTPETVSRDLRTNPSYAEQQLKELERAGIVVRVTDGGGVTFKYSDEAELVEAASLLRTAYNTRRSTIINLIYSQPMEKIRDLANAFVFKKD